MATRMPPRFVPTLTEVVQPSGPAPLSPAPVAPVSPIPSVASVASAAPVAPVSPLSQEQIAQRVMQRVDLALERRLREAVAAVVLEQTSALVPTLREHIEEVVREVVAAAVAEEMQVRQRNTGGSV